MPPLRPAAFYGPRQKLAYLPPGELEAARPWRTVTFTGRPVTDFFNLEATENHLRALAADTSRAGGVRVRFGPRVSYRCLFEVLSRGGATSQRCYWLDVRHAPLTVYFVTFEPKDSTER